MSKIKDIGYSRCWFADWEWNVKHPYLVIETNYYYDYNTPPRGESLIDCGTDVEKFLSFAKENFKKQNYGK